MFLIYLPVELIHVKVKQRQPWGTSPLPGKVMGQWPSHGPEHHAEKLHLVTLQDTCPSNQDTKGQVTKVAKKQPSQLQCICHLFLFHPTSSFTNRTDVFWKLKFGLQISKSASASVKCIPYLITIAITVTATSNPKSKAAPGPTQSRFYHLEAATHTLCYTPRNSRRRDRGSC